MLPRINQTLHIQINSNTDSNQFTEYQSRLADIDKDTLAIEYPMDMRSGKILRIHENTKISISYVGANGAKYHFTSHVTGFREDVIRLVLIAKPNLVNITKVQRRNYVRVDAILEISCEINENVKFTALTRDISGGGMSFLCDSKIPLEDNQSVKGWILLDEGDSMPVDHVKYEGEIVRTRQIEDSKKQLVMLQFTTIAYPERQKLIRYCLNKQIEHRK